MQQILLCGFMGSGKSTLLKKARVGFAGKVVDLDSLVEATEGCEISKLVSQNGWKYFRNAERECFERTLCNESLLLMALGGGTEVATDWQLVWLDTPFEICLQRIRHNQAARPLAFKSDDELLELYNHRCIGYRRAKYILKLEDQMRINCYSDLLATLGMVGRIENDQ